MKRNTTSAAARAFKKVKKESISTLKKKAWAVFSKWIRNRDNYTCFTCGKYDENRGHFMHAGHYISRSHNATLFDEENVHAQCYYCNVRERGNVAEYTPRLMQKLGTPGFKALLARGRTTKQFTPQELKDLLTKYQQP